MSLSPREKEVLSLVASGFTLNQVARRLGVSLGTVQEYRNRTFEKLGATSSAHAVALAFKADVELQILSVFVHQKND